MYIKTALQITKNGTPKDTKAKEQAHTLKKLTSEWILQRPKQNRTERHQTRIKMATGNKREVTWCFMPSQPVRLYEGEEREKYSKIEEL